MGKGRCPCVYYIRKKKEEREGKKEERNLTVARYCGCQKESYIE